MFALGFGTLEWKRRKKKKETEKEKEDKVAPFLDPEGKEEKCGFVVRVVGVKQGET